MDVRDKLKVFLNNKINELNKEIKKLNRKNMFVQIVHGTLLVISITSASVVTIIASLAVPPLVIACVSSLSAVSTIFSIKFDLKRKKEKLSKAIKQLNVLKDRLDYVVSCNGNITEDECNAILKEFRE